MNCPKCNASVPKSKLEYETGICNDCGCRIWKKRIPGRFNGLSLIVGGLIFVAFLGLNFITKSTGGTGSSYGFPFEAGRYTELHQGYGEEQGYKFSIDYGYFLANISCTIIASLLGWLLTLAFLRNVWIQHHFAVLVDDDEEDSPHQAEEKDGISKPRTQEIHEGQFDEGALDDDPLDAGLASAPFVARRNVVAPNFNQLKTMASGAKLVFISGLLTTVFMVTTLTYAILASLIDVRIPLVVVGLLMVAMLAIAVDLLGRFLCIAGAPNKNERSAGLLYLWSSFFGVAMLIVCVGTSSLLGDRAGPPAQGVTFGGIFLVGSFVVVACFVVGARISFCRAVSDNAAHEQLRDHVEKTKNAFLALLGSWVVSIPLGYAIGYAIGKRSQSIADLNSSLGGVVAGFQFVLGAVAINAVVRHLLMYRFAEKFFRSMAKQQVKEKSPNPLA